MVVLKSHTPQYLVNQVGGYMDHIYMDHICMDHTYRTLYMDHISYCATPLPLSIFRRWLHGGGDRR